MSKPTQEMVKQLEAQLAQAERTQAKLEASLTRSNLIHEVSVSLSRALDFETIVTKAVGFARYLDATSGEIHLLTDTGEVYLKSTYPERNKIDDIERQTLVREVLQKGLDAWCLDTGQLALVLDTIEDDRWLNIEYEDQTLSVRSAIAAPIQVDQGKLTGAISFVHPEPNHFHEQDLTLLKAITSHLTNALENAYQVTDIRNNLHEAHLMLDVSRHLSSASNMRAVYNAVLQSVTAIGADVYMLLTCHGLNNKNQPTHATIAYIGDTENPNARHPLTNRELILDETPGLLELVQTQEALIVENINHNKHIADNEREILNDLNVQSIVLNPLITRIHVMGILAIGYKSGHIFTERELAVYRTLCNQTTIALEHVQQIERTEQALAETQTLYRAGRVLAGADNLQDILQEALIEFVYSLMLDQGGIVLITPDQQFGQLMAYIQQGEIKDVDALRFKIDPSIPYQDILMSGQPFVSTDVPNDAQIDDAFSNFNEDQTIKSILQAPMIINGNTIGWIGADAVNDHHEFSQRDIDLARAMADQIAITIQNRRLLEQSERRAELLKAVATVGEAVTGRTDINEVMELTVNLIRDSFGFYHVSIFLIDEAREWAVVKASTGKVGEIMVKRPHKLGVGSNSIVGYVTHNAKPRIALDVGKDAVHFNNPLLPKTRSEMALPLVSRGITTGALDVQSVEPNAFTNEDVETLQIMTDQITTAIDTARLFAETQRRLHEQAMLYRVGTKVSTTLNMQETTDILVSETSHMLNMAKCSITLLEDNDTAHVVSDYVRRGSRFSNEQGQRYKISEFASWPKILATKKEMVIHLTDDDEINSWETRYLAKWNGSAAAIVPILMRSEVIGLLEVYDDYPGRRITEDNINLLDSVALQAANAIENARLFEAANESQGFMNAIINQIPDPIFIQDTHRRWLVVNRAFTKEILGETEAAVVGETELEFLDDPIAEWLHQYGDKMFTTGRTQETENVITDKDKRERMLYMRNIPLTLNSETDKPDYLIGMIQDITERKQREIERERLIDETRRTLERTQMLYRVSNTLSTGAEIHSTFEIVLGEYLTLLNQKHGSIMLYNKDTNANIAIARYIDGEAVQPNLALPIEEDKIFQHLQNRPKPLIINNPKTNPLTQENISGRGQNVTTMLFLPMIIRNQTVGSVVVDSTEASHKFSNQDIEIGQAIVDQLTIWLENRQLLEEAQYRSDSLQTASEVSRAASSILYVDQLIETVVNLIRDQFNFYYVGLFLLDAAKEWAVLKAGTGQAGRTQLARKHQLKVGSESMIGWSIANRKARIALDVGEEAVHFKNPILPDTHSEMALPLVSRDKVLGALTVQSTKRLAFSDEDITLLQTMADQIANAITNANLFTQTQEALAEAESLYEVTQALANARDAETIYGLAVDSSTRAEVDSVALFMYTEPTEADNGVVYVEQKNSWSKSNAGAPLISDSDGTRLAIDDFVIESKMPLHKHLLITDIAQDSHIADKTRQMLIDLNIHSLLILPLSAHQDRIGFLLAAYKSSKKEFNPQQMRYFETVAQQTVTALENMRLLDASQRRARREEIIREISVKIRNAGGVDDILKTTVTELGKVVGAAQGRISLGLSSSPEESDNGKTNGSSTKQPLLNTGNEGQ